MRCPKCGYISFDHMESCLKCKKKIAKSVVTEGTTYQAAAPSFLRVPEKDVPNTESGAEAVEGEEFSFGADDDLDFSDPDLDVLVADNDDEELVSFDDEGLEGDFQLESDDEEDDEEVSFDFDFDDGEGSNLTEDDEQPTQAVLDVPDELTDISDLAPPDEKNSPVSSLSSSLDLSLDDEMSLDEDLHLDGLDLELGLSNNENVSETELSLSLDDIDLSSEDILGGSSDLDDLSLSLDLDGLDTAPAAEEEKKSGSLDGISLSLD